MFLRYQNGIYCAWVEDADIQTLLQAKKELLTVYSINAKDEELAGEQLSAFGGFFKQEFRDYDYFVGRSKAIDFLKNLQLKNSQGEQEGHLFLLNFAPGQDLRSPTVNWGDVTLSNIDQKLRKQVKNLLLESLGRIIDSVEKRPFIALPLKFFVKQVAEDKLEKRLKLKP